MVRTFSGIGEVGSARVLEIPKAEPGNKKYRHTHFRTVHTIFRKQVIDFNSESDPRKADSIFHLENECVCFHTGLYTRQYKGIYGYFERNNFSDSLRDWYFRGFCDELSPKLRYIEPLPQKPVYHMAQSGINFNPEWPIRVNVNHILGDEENLERIPAKIRKAKNLPLLFETAVELGRRKAVIEPEKIKEQILAVRATGRTNMFDTNMVQVIAKEMKFYELVVFIEEHKGDYAKFILTGEC